MKNLIILLLGIIIGMYSQFIIFAYANMDKPHVQLPEQYQMIDGTTAIKGYYDKENNILTIGFDNSIQFVWERLEKDIPQDGIAELQLKTNENTVYLNPVDE